MTNIIAQTLVGFGATLLGTGAGFGINKAARAATKKAIKPENFTSQEEFEKAYKMRSLRNGIIGGAATIVADAAIGVGASYVICDVIPNWGDEACDGEETTTDSSSDAAAFI